MFEGMHGKKVLITGSGSGMGSCIAELLGSYGAIIGIHYNSSKKNAGLIEKKIRDSGGDAYLLQANLLIEKDRDKIIPQFIDQCNGLDVLINNAGGVIGNHHFLGMDTASWNATINLNLTAPFFLSQMAFQYMKEHGGGKIINISSIASKYGGSNMTTHYGAAKAGLDSVTRTLSREGAPYNILVNSIQPGVIDTPFHKKIGRSSLDERVKKIPLRRAGSTLDVARLCLFLASECGDYITGQIYGVTGGD
jgi:NAD(P)-dependent dehydrogenase (short-subunit alcohol dehydrogenase family)